MKDNCPLNADRLLQLNSTSIRLWWSEVKLFEAVSYKRNDSIIIPEFT